MAREKPARDGESSRSGWLSPTGITAFAALITAVVGGLTLIVRSGDDTQHRTSSPTTAASRPLGAVASGQSPAKITRTVHGTAALTALLDEVAATELPEGEPNGTFDPLTDKAHKVGAEMPARWHDQEVTSWLNGDVPIGLALIASQEESRFFKTYSVPGAFIGVADRLPGKGTPDSLQESKRGQLTEECIEVASGQLEGDGVRGLYSAWTRCGPTKSMTVFYVSSNDRGYSTAAYFRLVGRTDVAAVDHVLRTLKVTPPIGSPIKAPQQPDQLPGQVLE